MSPQQQFEQSGVIIAPLPQAVGMAAMDQQQLYAAQQHQQQQQAQYQMQGLVTGIGVLIKFKLLIGCLTVFSSSFRNRC